VLSIFKIESHELFAPRLTLNCHPSDLCLWNIHDYRWESMHAQLILEIFKETEQLKQGK
jgi:hypothetical protein